MRENSVFIKLVRVILIFFTLPKQKINVSWRIRLFHTCREKIQQRISENMKWNKFPTSELNEFALPQNKSTQKKTRKNWINRYNSWALAHESIEANEGREKKSELRWQRLRSFIVLNVFYVILWHFVVEIKRLAMTNATSDQWPVTNQRSAISERFRKNMCPNHHINKVDIFTRL